MQLSSPSESVFVVIPTLNERENICILIEKLAALSVVKGIVIVDDHSSDGTAAAARECATRYPRVRVIVHERIDEHGLGSAYKAGFRKALETGATAIVQIDADFSHDPAVIPSMVTLLRDADVVVGSRRMPGGDVTGWNRWRDWGSRFANRCARIILRLPATDVTSGFRIWRADTIRNVLADGIRSSGYSFQVEMLYKAFHGGARIHDTPITFIDREKGQSKLSRHEVVLFFYTVLRLFWKYSQGRFVAGVMVGLTFLAALPLIVTLLAQPPDTALTGVSVYAPIDLPVYYSTIRQVAEGVACTLNQFTTEAHACVCSPIWFGVGLLARWFHWEPWVAFHIARLVLVPLTVLVAWWCAKQFLPQQFRRHALLFMLFVEGTGSLIQLFTYEENLAHIGLDAWVAEGFLFHSVLQSPHFLLGFILFMLVVGFWFRATTARTWKQRAWFVVGSSLCATALFSFHPFHIISLGAILLCHTAVVVMMKTSPRWQIIGALCLWSVLALPGAVYQFMVQWGDPVLASRVAQNVTTTPSVQTVLFSFPVLVIFAAVGVRQLWKRGYTNEAVFLLVWGSVQLCALFAPVHFNRRLVLGLEVDLALLASVGWACSYAYIQKRASMIYQQLWFAITLILLFSSSAIVYANYLSAPASLKELLYIPISAQHGYDWIVQNTEPDAVILADNWYANFLPSKTNRRTYAGHEIETVDWLNKYRLVRTAYTSVNQSEVEQLVASTGADYAFEGPGQNLLPPHDAVLVFEEGETRIYALNVGAQ